ncbi:MAG: hypothetical protein F6J93_35355 [Oscillatoria sp. SIO1A7]|nr:hypothetical protein [Oscillatoria sp. SIO1A7]
MKCSQLKCSLSGAFEKAIKCPRRRERQQYLQKRSPLLWIPKLSTLLPG